MRPLIAVAVIVVAFLLGAFVEHTYDAPFGLALASFTRVSSSEPPVPPVPPQTGSTAVPHYSNVRGLEDAPRNDIPQGANTDFQRCVNTMILRREPEAEARTVCQKIISGISG